MSYLIDDLVKEGLRCPNCGGDEIRGGHHDWHHRDALICEKCGLRWIEDFADFTQMWRFQERRFIWVMCDAWKPLVAVLNPGSADDGGTREAFVKRGQRRRKK